MCDKGYDVTFRSKGCEIKYENMGKVIKTIVRTSSNVYIFKEKNENFYLGKLDESWS